METNLTFNFCMKPREEKRGIGRRDHWFFQNVERFFQWPSIWGSVSLFHISAGFLPLPFFLFFFFWPFLLIASCWPCCLLVFPFYFGRHIVFLIERAHDPTIVNNGQFQTSSESLHSTLLRSVSTHSDKTTRTVTSATPFQVRRIDLKSVWKTVSLSLIITRYGLTSQLNIREIVRWI